jgi:3-hydroxybutyryl-CoA dehydrogenase
MAKNSLAIIGESRLAQELSDLAREKGLEVSLLSRIGDIAPTTPVIIETYAGDGEKKKSLLQKLDDFLSPASVIVTSCLAYGTTHMGAWTKKPERLVGFATFYPLKDRKLIEIAAGLGSGESAVSAAEQLFKSLGKETVRVKDSAGLTFPRIVSLIINEAARSLEEGVASAEEIDIAMKLGVNYPRGPLRWADEIGLDEVLSVLEGLHRETGEDRYRPAPLIHKLASAGFLGEVSGRGFYCYNEAQVKT